MRIAGFIPRLVIGFCALLWWRGQHLEAIARNPWKISYRYKAGRT